MAKRKGFFDHISRPEDDLARMRDIEALLVPRRIVVQDIPIERIRPNPFQARQVFDQIDELAQAIRRPGVYQPPAGSPRSRAGWLFPTGVWRASPARRADRRADRRSPVRLPITLMMS